MQTLSIKSIKIKFQHSLDFLKNVLLYQLFCSYLSHTRYYKHQQTNKHYFSLEKEEDGGREEREGEGERRWGKQSGRKEKDKEILMDGQHLELGKTL